MSGKTPFYVLKSKEDGRVIALALHPLAKIMYAVCETERMSPDGARWFAETWRRCPVAGGQSESDEVANFEQHLDAAIDSLAAMEPTEDDPEGQELAAMWSALSSLRASWLGLDDPPIGPAEAGDRP